MVRFAEDLLYNLYTKSTRENKSVYRLILFMTYNTAVTQGSCYTQSFNSYGSQDNVYGWLSDAQQHFHMRNGLYVTQILFTCRPRQKLPMIYAVNVGFTPVNNTAMRDISDSDFHSRIIAIHDRNVQPAIMPHIPNRSLAV